MHRLTKATASILALGTITLAACGGDDDDAAPLTEPPASEVVDTDPPGTETTTAPTAPPPAALDSTDSGVSEPLVELAETDLGPVIVAADGLTLYLFDPDAAGEPTCTGACAGTWPPHYVEGGADLTAGDGLDAALLDVVAHPDGGDMLVYNGWPLYYYAGDQAPGDTNGQGVNDVWWVVDGAGEPIVNSSVAGDESDGGSYDY